ncbi:MAG: hypothetical protein WBA51_05940 [Erythrobacter sp.]
MNALLRKMGPRQTGRRSERVEADGLALTRLNRFRHWYKACIQQGALFLNPFKNIAPTDPAIDQRKRACDNDDAEKADNRSLDHDGISRFFAARQKLAGGVFNLCSAPLVL